MIFSCGDSKLAIKTSHIGEGPVVALELFFDSLEIQYWVTNILLSFADTISVIPTMSVYNMFFQIWALESHADPN